MQATGSGSIWETPFHASMDAAALAMGCPSGPVRYVIRFAATPLYANLSAISIAACKTNQRISRVQESIPPVTMIAQEIGARTHYEDR
jgi:hypothetical protein